MEHYTGNYRLLFIRNQRTDIPVYWTYSTWSRCIICCLPHCQGQEKPEEILIKNRFASSNIACEAN